MERKSVAIIGAGPAGLLSAWAAHEEGWHVTLLEKEPRYHPETIFSLQFMHEPCGLEARVRKLDLRYKVHPDESRRFDMGLLYNAKIGRPLDAPNSMRFFKNEMEVWSLKDAYRFLYNFFEHKIFRADIVFPTDLIKYASEYDQVINTAPLDKLLPAGQWPVRTALIALNWLPFPIGENTCMYDLDPQNPWFRITDLDGGQATELVPKPDFGELSKEPRVVPLRKVALGAKIPRAGLPNNVHFTGRWGSWNPDALTHHAYQDTKRILSEGTVQSAGGIPGDDAPGSRDTAIPS